jgi:hypothetical protein
MREGHVMLADRASLRNLVAAQAVAIATPRARGLRDLDPAAAALVRRLMLMPCS